MKLTKTHRRAFVTAVMQDVPQVNYEEQARKLLLEASIAALPPKVRAIAKDKDLQHLLHTESHWMGSGFGAATVYIGRSVCHGSYMTEEVKAKLKELNNKDREQSMNNSQLEAKITSVIASCSTLKSAKERLPEFVKYLPEEEEKSDNLPAIANLVADLTKLGWPKASKVAKDKS